MSTQNVATTPTYYTLSPAAYVTFPNNTSDWTWVQWLRLYNGNAGNAYQYFTSATPFGQANEFSIFMNEASEGSFNNILELNMNDSSGSNPIIVRSSTTPGTSTAWLHIALRYTLTTPVARQVEMLVDGVSVGTAAFTIGVAATTPPNGIRVGTRFDVTPNPARSTDGRYEDHALFHRALSNGEISSLAGGAAVSSILQTGIQLNIDGTVFPPVEKINSTVITNAGTTFSADSPLGAPPSGNVAATTHKTRSPFGGGFGMG